MGNHEDIKRFATAFEKVLLKMQEETNNCCMVLTKNDIGKQDLSLIGYIGKHGSLIMRDIAGFLDVPYSTATGIVDKLVEKGYLTRQYSKENRRIVLVTLTKKGKNVEDGFKCRKEELSELVLADLDKKDKDLLINLLERVAHNMEKQNPAEI